MPANLPPQYFDAEKTYRTARNPLEKIAALEEMLAIMPKHKGTDHLRAELRTRIARLNQSLDKKTATQRASMMVEKVGAAQIAVVGPPNVGKSQLVSSITNASPTIAAYPFTTQSATPGMMEYENIQIQLVDIPPLTEQPEWWLLNIIKRADALLVMVDLSDSPLEQMETVLAQLRGRRIGLQGIPFEGEEEDVPLVLKKALILGNKKDWDTGNKNHRILQNLYGAQMPVIAISAAEGTGLEELKLEIYRALDIIRVYTKAPGKKPDYTDPIVLPKGSTLGDAASSVHKDFSAKLKYARIWGSGKHDGMMVKRDHILQDGDVIELHL